MSRRLAEEDGHDTCSGLVHGEDLEIGRVYRLGSHTFTESDIVDFATAWDPLGIHVDSIAADDGAYGGLIASGLHTLAVYQRLAVTSVLTGWNVIAGRCMRDVRFLRPVRPGNTLSGTLVIDDIVFDDRDRTLVTTAAELVNERGERVMTAEVEALVRARPQSTP